MRKTRFFVCVFIGLHFSAAVAQKPVRIASLNLCTDQLLVMTVAPERIAAVTFLARDPSLSVVAERAADLPVTHGDMESVAALWPDLVLAGPHGASAAGRLMRARGIPVVRIGLAADFGDIREQIRTVAAAVQEPAAGERLVGALDATLAALPAAPERRPSALLYGANGFTAGAGTLTDAVLRAAGFANAAGSVAGGYGFVPLEQLAAQPPDALVVETIPQRYPSLAHALLRHPAVAAMPSADLISRLAAASSLRADARLASAFRRFVSLIEYSAAV